MILVLFLWQKRSDIELALLSEVNVFPVKNGIPFLVVCRNSEICESAPAEN